jgi:RNA 2',3'-cyclic 3'-phosphodiesterase
MSEMWRVFAAVELAREIKQQIQTTAHLLGELGWNARWVKPDKAHLTVRFYGDLVVDRLPILQDELRDAVRSVPGFDIVVWGAGAFPNPKRPRVIWLGMDDPSGRLEPLKLAVERASGRAGLEEETGPYKPHLTVGRLHPQFRITGSASADALARVGDFDPIPMPVSDIVLFRSQLGRGGSQYTVIDRFPLGEPLAEAANDDQVDRNGDKA